MVQSFAPANNSAPPPPEPSGQPEDHDLEDHLDEDPNLLDGLRNGNLPGWLRTAAAVAWRVLIVVAALVVLGMGVARFKVIIVPLLVSMLLAAAFSPPVRWLAKHGVPMLLATWAVLLSAAGLVIGGGWLLAPPLAAGFTDVGAALGEAYVEAKDWLAEGPVGLTPDDIAETETQIVERLRSVVQTDLPSRAGVAVEVVTGFFLTLVISFFYIKDGRRIRDGLVRLFPAHDRRRALAALQRAWSVLRRYLLGVVVVGAADAAIIGLGLVLIGVPHVVPVMVLTFLAAFFPLVGAIFAGAVATLLALAAGGIGDALLVIGLTVIVQQLDGDLIAPVVYSHALDLHPLTILIALTAGTVTAGIIGAFLAVPVLALIVAVTDAWREAGDREPARAAAA